MATGIGLTSTEWHYPNQRLPNMLENSYFSKLC